LTECAYRKLEAVACITISAAVGYYGNGEHDALYIIRNDSRIYRPALAVSGILMLANILVFLYVQVAARLRKKFYKHPELAVTWAIPTASCCCVMSGLFCVFACWGVWGWLTPFLGYIHLLSLVTCVHFIPNVIPYKDHED
jgi:hypothetical protein